MDKEQSPKVAREGTFGGCKDNLVQDLRLDLNRVGSVQWSRAMADYLICRVFRIS